MANDPNRYERALASDAFEHDDTANVKVKRVGIHGWNVDSLEYKRVAVDANGKLQVDEWGLNDLEEASTTVTYCGYEKSDGTWNVIKIDTITGYAIGWATVLNNPTRASYTLGWTNRATLTYGDYTDAF